MGLTGVSVFFFISGYAITIASKHETPKQFLLRRIFRIFPLYFAATILEILLSPDLEFSLLSAKKILTNLFMVGDLFNIPPNIAGVAWTLRIEVLFYFIVWLSMIIEKKLNRDIPIRMFLLFATSLGSAFVLRLPTSASLGNQNYVGIFFPLLIIGVVSALVRNQELKQLHGILLGIVATLLHIYLVRLLKPDFLTLGNYLLASAVLIIAMFNLKPQHKIAGIISRFSQVTFGFYLLHTFFFSFVLEKISIYLIPNGTKGLLILKVLVTFLVFRLAFAIFDFFEKPLISYSKSLK